MEIKFTGKLSYIIEKLILLLIRNPLTINELSFRPILDIITTIESPMILGQYGLEVNMVMRLQYYLDCHYNILKSLSLKK